MSAFLFTFTASMTAQLGPAQAASCSLPALLALLQGDNLVGLDGVFHPAIGACTRPRSFRGRLRAGVTVAAVAKDPHSCACNSLHPFSSPLLHGFRGIQVEGFC